MTDMHNFPKLEYYYEFIKPMKDFFKDNEL